MTKTTKYNATIEDARAIQQTVGSNIHWRPLPLPEEKQFAVVLDDGIAP